jgi:hypothetical protein
MSEEYAPMYCEKCDRWEDDQIAAECGICLRCGGPLTAPEDDDGQPDEAQEWADFDPDC